MYRTIGLIGSTIALCGCNFGLLPGMENLHTAKMRKQVRSPKVKVCPTLIPITPALISDQTISKYYYRVAPSDVINISVWQHPEFNMSASMPDFSDDTPGASGGGGYLVNTDGYIFFPLIGNVMVAGKTVEQIREVIAKRLVKYIPDPQVSVRVGSYRSRKVYVLGEVNKTGFLPINDQPLTLADALAKSGWLSPDTANPSAIYVIRGQYQRPKIYWLDAKTPDKLLLAEHFSLQPQDILFVSSAGLVSVNRVLQQVLPVVQTVWFMQNMINA